MSVGPGKEIRRFWMHQDLRPTQLQKNGQAAYTVKTA